jgi:hypothetical protein
MRTRVEHIRDADQITRRSCRAILAKRSPGLFDSLSVRKIIITYHGHLEFVNSILAYLAFFALGFISTIYIKYNVNSALSTFWLNRFGKK